jgi:hypothetical protein
MEFSANTNENVLRDGIGGDVSLTTSLHELFPKLSDEELKSVASTLNNYCATVLRIYERIKREQPNVIDELMQSRTIKTKVDS